DLRHVLAHRRTGETLHSFGQAGGDYDHIERRGRSAIRRKRIGADAQPQPGHARYSGDRDDDTRNNSTGNTHGNLLAKHMSETLYAPASAGARVEWPE